MLRDQLGPGVRGVAQQLAEPRFGGDRGPLPDPNSKDSLTRRDNGSRGNLLAAFMGSFSWYDAFKVVLVGNLLTKYHSRFVCGSGSPERIPTKDDLQIVERGSSYISVFPNE